MIDARIPLGIQQVDGVGMFQNAQQMRLSQMLMEQKREEMEYRRAQDARTQEAAAKEAQFKNMATIAKLTAGVTAENYAQRLATAQQMGLDVSGLPQQFDPAFMGELNAVATALSNPEKRHEIETKLDLMNITDPEERARYARSMIFEPKVVADALGGVNVIQTDPGALAPITNQGGPTQPVGKLTPIGGGGGGNVTPGFPR